MKNIYDNDIHSIVEGKKDLSVEAEGSIISRLKGIVNANKKKIAIIDKDKKIYYEEFMKDIYSMTNFLLMQSEFCRELPVILLLDGSYSRYVALYGVLAAGSYYLPMEPEVSNIERIAEIIKQSESRIVITNKSFHKILNNKINDDIKILEIEEIQLDKISSKETMVNIKPEDPAYMIYTSGSTGKPKGVIVSHKSILNLVISLYEEFELKTSDIGIAFTSFSFDSSGCDIYTYILNAIPLVCVKNRKEYIYDIEKLNQFCLDNSVTVLFLPTVLAEKFVTLNNDSLRVLYFGGEKFCKNTITKYNLYNSYGLTETGILNTVYKIEGNEKEIPLGNPILNSGYAIVDENNKVVPKGQVGEIVIWGPGIALKYQNDSILTNEKFIRIPELKNYRCCKTGDMGFISIDNQLYFKGRKDKQVKLSGYRIELGEIKFYLQKYDGIKISVPMVLEDGELSFLVNFYVSDYEIDSDLINEFLSRYLPYYMIPVYHIRIKDMVYTVNGKVDYKKLEEIFFMNKNIMKNFSEDLINKEYLELFIINTFCKVLNLKKEEISKNTNFFEVGGDSLKLVRLQLMLQDELNINLDFSNIYEDFTILSIINLISNNHTCRGETNVSC